MHYKKIYILVALLSTNVYADNFTASVGGDYSTGKYFGAQESTDVFYMPLSLAYNRSAFSFKLTVPYISVNGPGDIVPGGFGSSASGGGSGIGAFGCASDNRKGASKPEDNGPCADPTTSTSTAKRDRTTESGLGDIVTGLTYTMLNQQHTSGWIVDLNGRIKFGTASEAKGLGSGKTDYAAGVNVDKYFGASYISAGFGYKILGEPSGVKYNDVKYGSIGGGYRFSNNNSMGISYDRSTSAIHGATQPQEISMYSSHRINDQFSLSAVIYTGLSNASPDIGGGLTTNYHF